MSRNPSLNHQMHMRMEKMKALGESRHIAKKEYKQYCQENNRTWNPSKTVGIHSYNTYNAYKQTSKEFIGYIRENYNIKNINNITKDQAEEYLKYREEQGLSPYTVTKDLSALNKLFNLDLNKKELGLSERSYKNITRSREDAKMDRKYNPDNYKDQITFAKASGCRRESVLSVQPKDFNYNQKGEITSVTLKEKGGREREATILKPYREQIKQLIEVKPYNQPIFHKYTVKIDNHAFRAEYARERYQEIIQNKSEVKEDYRGYDKQAILQVSQDLGHNRPSVVVEHYMK